MTQNLNNSVLRSNRRAAEKTLKKHRDKAPKHRYLVRFVRADGTVDDLGGLRFKVKKQAVLEASMRQTARDNLRNTLRGGGTIGDILWGHVGHYEVLDTQQKGLRVY